MKKYLSIFLLLTVICGSSVFASPTKGSIDGVMGDTEWTGLEITEDASSSGDNYDVERLGLFINNNMMYFGLQTDFVLNPVLPYTDHYGVDAGDFIFDFGSDNNYELALSFSFDTNGKIVFDIYSDSVKWNSTTDFKNFDVGAPYAHGVSEVRSPILDRLTPNEWSSYDADGAPWQAQDTVNHKPVAGTYGYSKTTNGMFNGGYTIEGAIDLNGLSDDLTKLFADNTTVTMHWQMECGNDFLKVKANYDYTPVPEPQTFLLFGFGLLALSSAGRYRFNKKA